MYVLNFFTILTHQRCIWSNECQDWSIAKVLTDGRLFNGVGKWLMSEILFGMTNCYKVLPWDPIGPFELENESKLFNMIALFRITCGKVAKYYDRFDITKHCLNDVATIHNRLLRAYRKKGKSYFLDVISSEATCYTFSGKDWNGKVYCYLQLPKDNLLVDSEKWTQIRGKPYSEADIGIGPICWHIKKDREEGIATLRK